MDEYYKFFYHFSRSRSVRLTEVNSKEALTSHLKFTNCGWHDLQINKYDTNSHLAMERENTPEMTAEEGADIATDEGEGVFTFNTNLKKHATNSTINVARITTSPYKIFIYSIFSFVHFRRDKLSDIMIIILAFKLEIHISDMEIGEQEEVTLLESGPPALPLPDIDQLDISDPPLPTTPSTTTPPASPTPIVHPPPTKRRAQ